MSLSKSSLSIASTVFYPIHQKDTVTATVTDTSNDNNSTQLFPMDTFLENKLTNMNKLFTIPHYQLYFHLPTEWNEICNMELPKDAQYLSQALTNNTNKITSYYFLKYNSPIQTPFSHLISTCTSKHLLLHIINCFVKILKAVHLLVENQIVHNFINLSNIQHCSKYEYRLSNFLYSFSIYTPENCIKPLFQKYEGEWLERPIELQLISYLLDQKLETLSCHNIDCIALNNLKHMESLLLLQSKELLTYKQDLYTYLNSFENKTWQQIWQTIIRYYHTWDIYHFAIKNIKILNILYQQNPNIYNYPFFNTFFPLLKQMICPLPNKRITTESSLSSFYNILNNIERKEWIQCINDLQV